MSLAARTQRIDSLCAPIAEVERLDRLVFSSTVPAAEFLAVQAAAKIFIAKCFGEPAGFSTEAELMRKIDREHSRLDNLTPNGKLMPKPHLNLEYNLFLRNLAAAIATLGLDAEIEEYRLPTLRYKPPPQLAKLENHLRPYATEKPHNEMWISSKNSDVIVIHLLIFGDTAQNHVRFYTTPVNFDEAWMRPIKDFNEVTDVLKQYHPIEKTPAPGKFYVFEGSAVHSTHLVAGAGGRISMEMFAVLKRKIQRPSPGDDLRQVDFSLAPPDFHRLGKSLILGVKDTLSGVVEMNRLIEL